MIDVHAHTFTAEHLPSRYLPWPLMGLLRSRLGAKVANALLRRLGHRHPLLRRVARFLEHQQCSQRENFEKLVDLLWEEHRYGQKVLVSKPPTIIVHAMDFTFAGLGRVPVSVEDQVSEACSLIHRHTSPFMFLPVDPRRQGVDFRGHCDHAGSLLEWVQMMSARHSPIIGLKVYPPLGFRFNDERLDPVWAWWASQNRPVMTHMGGTTVRGRGVTPDMARSLMSVEDIRDVLLRHPGLRVCLGHFGGSRIWSKPVDHKYLVDIMSLLNDFPQQAFVDISYAAFAQATRGLLQGFLCGTSQEHSVLFGTDFPMVSIERVDMRHQIAEIRGLVGEHRWHLMTHTNPLVYLFGQDDDMPKMAKR